MNFSLLALTVVGVLSAVTDAVPGPMTPVSPFDPTVLYVANEAARQLLGPSAYVETVWGAAGRNWIVPGRYFYYRIVFLSGPWWLRRQCVAHIRYSARGLPYVVKRFPWMMPWGRSRCW